ncbi:MAG: NotI family restriction endonuclease [Planctomycetaceae bacterium]
MRQLSDAVETVAPPCPFLSTAARTAPCWKPGGVCSLRRYRSTDGPAIVDPGDLSIRTTCPSRFEQDQLIYRWIAEVILNTTSAVPIGQVGFLERIPLAGPENESTSQREDVGRIDNVLITPGTNPLQWCPVEIQAVYFSGDSMDGDFKGILEHSGEGIPFPRGRRRPDYRSSGPKRLMPQLQTKVPTLRRWGKKMAVVVDEDFFENMGRMETVRDISNCDVAWFVVKFNETSGSPMIAEGSVHFTELEASVQGLIAGRPVTQGKFEERILAKLARLPSGPIEIPSDE